jgi:hypothetical protein
MQIRSRFANQSAEPVAFAASRIVASGAPSTRGCVVDAGSDYFEPRVHLGHLHTSIHCKLSNEEEFPMSEYLFLYRGGNRPTSPQDAQAVMQQWMTWLQDLAKQGHIKDQGQPLEPVGKVVTGNQKTVTDGPFAEAKDLVGGYTLVSAKHLDEAAELSKGCPIFARGGSVEVRPVMKM